MSKEIKVGDKVYFRIWGGLYLTSVKSIGKVWVTLDNSARIKREALESGGELSRHDGEAIYFRPTAELDAAYELDVLRSEARRVRISDLSADQLRRVIAIFNENKTPPSCS